MYNGYDARLVDAWGCRKNGIEHARAKMMGRGVLLDIARHRGVDSLADGEAIYNDELDACAAASGRGGAARRFRHHPHRPDGALPQGGRLGHLRRW